MAAFLRRIAGSPSTNTSPPVHDDDVVYPLHMLDDTKTLRDIVVAWTLRFDDVLDVEKLHDSLSRLLEIGDWRMLGGRLRLKVISSFILVEACRLTIYEQDNGKQEIHAPRTFTEDRPAVFTTRETFPMAIEQHPVAKKLPKATTHASIQLGPKAFHTFAARGDAPATLEDFVHSDLPMLSLHITSFTDATLVGLSWPHALMDVMGQSALLHAWSLVLAGREAEVLKVLGVHEDAVIAALEAPSAPVEEFKLGAKRLAGTSMLWFGARFGWDLLTNKTAETRTICLPKKFVEDLRQQAMSELAAEQGEEKDIFISDGDALTAWALRSVALSSPQPRPVTALHALNMRFRLPSLINAGGVYVRNMAIAACTFLSPETATGNLGPIALANRRHLIEQSTEPQVLAFMRELCYNPALGANPSLVFGDPNAILVPFTNWTKADFTNIVDFSPAVVRGEGADESRVRANAPGSLTSHHVQSLRSSPTERNIFVILGKDHGENYWVMATLHPPAWEVVEKSLGIV